MRDMERILHALLELRSAGLAYGDALAENSGVIFRWILIHKPGCVPEVKRPHPNDFDSSVEMIREMIGHYEGARFSLCELNWNMELSADDGHQVVEIYDSMITEDASSARGGEG